MHARGAAAHGYLPGLRVAERATPGPASCRTPPTQTPVFVRFSTVAGSRGSTDLARDVRGFAVKFYTDEGNFDLVGNNIPVFFIQDAIKFPDLVHAVKPEPHNEIPQAASAHDTFWDFISLMPESMHMIMWVMSDRAIPRSFRMMEGFGVHTFRLVNARGDVALRQVPLEAAARRALGGVGRGAEDLRQGPGLPPPRPVGGDRGRRRSRSGSSACRSSRRRTSTSSTSTCWTRPRSSPRSSCRCSGSGRLTLNRNPDNFFAETEQVAFHPGHVVPGIDFTNDPLLQGRLFSYTDTQLTRLGGPNFHEIPINRPDRAGPQQPARRPHAPDDQLGPRRLRARTRSAAAARCRPARADGGFVTLSGADRRAEGARAQREVLRPLQPGDAVLEQPVRRPRSSTSSRRCASSSARSRCRRSASGWSACWPTWTGRWPGRSPRGSGLAVPKIDRPAEPQHARRRRSQEVPADAA